MQQHEVELRKETTGADARTTSKSVENARLNNLSAYVVIVAVDRIYGSRDDSAGDLRCPTVVFVRRIVSGRARVDVGLGRTAQRC